VAVIDVGLDWAASGKVIWRLFRLPSLRYRER
jgi:hypothetical protein